MKETMNITFKERDEFKREGVAKKLLTLLESDAPASPVLLDGPWGSGKTEFCHKLNNLALENESPLKLLYIDAFKYDHSDDPLIMLAASLSTAVESPEKKADLLKKAIPVAKVLGKIAGKAAISWALKATVEKIGEDLSEAASSEGEDLVNDGIKRVFQDFEEVEENLKVYKAALAELAKKQKIVVIIDELDRCRPTFALSLLEKVKHVFGVEGIKFLFSTNLHQLCSIVKKQYGPEIDAEIYLSKFFNFTIRLPADHTHNEYEYFQNSAIHFFNLIASSEFKTACSPRSSVHSFFRDLIKRDKRSLRDVETLHRNLMIYNSVAGEHSVKENTIWLYSAIVMFGVYIYTFKPQFTVKLLEGTLTMTELSDAFGVNIKSLSTNERNLNALICAMLVLDQDPKVEQTGVWDVVKVKEWDEEIYRSFTNGRGPSRGERTAVLQRTIRKLQLL